MSMARTQTLVQLNDELLSLLDERSVQLRRSRSDLIRSAVERYLHDELEADIDRRIVDGYVRIPPGEIWSDADAIELIREEPW
jgi:metal-responsive CopG/Arc/MetJ family transcriptional regulator